MITRQYIQWRMSSRSDGDGNCVEVARVDDGFVGVRDSKDVAGPVLEFNPVAWRTFIDAVQHAEFDQRLSFPTGSTFVAVGVRTVRRPIR
jgi:hypothetical protein